MPEDDLSSIGWLRQRLTAVEAMLADLLRRLDALEVQLRTNERLAAMRTERDETRTSE